MSFLPQLYFQLGAKRHKVNPFFFAQIFGLKSQPLANNSHVRSIAWPTMNLNRVCVSSETGFGAAIIYLSSFITETTIEQSDDDSLKNMNIHTHIQYIQPTFAKGRTTKNWTVEINHSLESSALVQDDYCLLTPFALHLHGQGDMDMKGTLNAI